MFKKYGGSSVSSTEKIKAIANKLIERKKKNPKIVVVVSAMGDTTDDFISIAKDITKSPDKRELDVLNVNWRDDICFFTIYEFEFFRM